MQGAKLVVLGVWQLVVLVVFLLRGLRRSYK